MASMLFTGEGVYATVTLQIEPYTEYVIPVNEVWNSTIAGRYKVVVSALPNYTISEVKVYDDNWDNWQTFTISEDGLTATYYNSYDMVSQFDVWEFIVTTIHDEPEPEPEPETDYVSGFNELYLTDYNILKSIASERLEISWGEPNSPTRVDLRDFIVNVLEVPFIIPLDLIGEEKPIKLGNFSLNTVAPIINADTIVLNIGTILVPNKFNNSYDYIDTEIKIHLPFIDTISLEIEYVIGYEISIDYVIDLFSGDLTVNIKSSKTDTVIYSKNHRLGRKIPFSTSTNKVVNSIGDSKSLDNGITTAFIEVIRNAPINLDMFSDSIIVQSKLINELGYVTINNIFLNSSATLNEKLKIVNLLKNGVFIK